MKPAQVLNYFGEQQSSRGQPVAIWHPRMRLVKRREVSYARRHRESYGKSLSSLQCGIAARVGSAIVRIFLKFHEA
jgi:hypothetical protein